MCTELYHLASISVMSGTSYSYICCNFTYMVTAIFKNDFIYLFMRDTEREAETQAEGEAGSMQGA